MAKYMLADVEQNPDSITVEDKTLDKGGKYVELTDDQLRSARNAGHLVETSKEKQAREEAEKAEAEAPPEEDDAPLPSREGPLHLEEKGPRFAQAAPDPERIEEIENLKGDELAEAVEEAGVDPNLTADEKREALLDQETEPGTPGSDTTP